MANRKYVGTFYSIDNALHKITELKAQGHAENEVYAITNEDNFMSMLYEQTAIELHGVNDDKWKDRFKLFMNGDELMLDAFTRMGFTKQQSEDYVNEVKDGGVALFVKDSPQNPNDENVKMDSGVERGLNGELLNGQNEHSQIIDSDGTIPRIDTRHL